MKKSLLLIVLSLFAVASYSQKSHIQIVAEAGISIYIDGDFVGVTNLEMKGLFIQDLEPGRHTIEAKKEGFKALNDLIVLDPGQVLKYSLEDLISNISISEEGEEDEDKIKRNIGNLKIQSLPVDVKIEIPGLNISYRKQKDSWTAENVPSGEFLAKFIWQGMSISHEIQIQPGMESHYMVFMIDGKIDLLGIYPINRVVYNDTTISPPQERIYHQSLLIELLGIKYHYEFKRLGVFVSAPLPISFGISYRLGKSIRPYLGPAYIPFDGGGIGGTTGVMFSIKRLMFDVGGWVAIDINNPGYWDVIPVIGVGYRF